MDGDTTIIQEALVAAKDSPVNAFANDTDILLLLIHHMTNDSTVLSNFYTRNVKKEHVTVV